MYEIRLLDPAKKLIGFDLYELRIKQSSNIVRMFYFQVAGKIYVITSGYVKKTNKTSRFEIERAEKLKQNFLKGDKNG
ncbi:type II toxin-antitoxin system RelE/ParE family toxin [Spirochaeta lutea]|uniref:type II toxin-antitoxin system RelE/ParE family toxin n=1 Tax=Spirochaeta lutea TaxID=1480694 RepID=UPI00068DD094|nr:type II toxin-antitoxin system RelE/ParE family toxin [Spirochaeta lutea]